MLEQPGEALGPIGVGEVGKISTHGEIWSATSHKDIQQGDPVRVVAIDGMRLTVRRATPQTPGGFDI